MVITDREHPGRVFTAAAAGLLACTGLLISRKRRQRDLDDGDRPGAVLDGGYSDGSFPVRIDRVPAVLYAMKQEDSRLTIEYLSPQVTQLMGYTAEEWKADIQNWRNHLHQDDRDRVIEERERCYRTGDPFQMEYRLVTRDGRVVWVQDDAVASGGLDGQAVRWEGVITDVTPLKEAEARLTRQVQRIASLRSIDMAITSSLDVRVTLNVVLDQVTAQLGVDGAAILLMSPHSREMEHAAHRGLRTSTITRSRVPLGEGQAGRAALNRDTLFIPNVSDMTAEQVLRPDLVRDEQIVSYVVTPLTSRGQVTGILELFNRAQLAPDDDWFDFLETLAAQAAIAIDSASMFDRLQRSNEELELAYDRTLEGWAAALELRDDETEGHSQRVTNLTLRLAKATGVAGRELTHIRRGALLHDIGKFGIPDRILLKPGPLDADEWALMRQHPILARDLLSRIGFLEPALDIPYSHHERWDGSGYPQGLKGLEIPFPARAFAVVDVWDALTSDRPYRAAWSRNEAWQYLRNQAGHEFDPGIVEVFLDDVLSRT